MDKLRKLLLPLILVSFVFSIKVEPWFPVVGQKVKFKLSNPKAYSACYDIVWDFGDGTQVHANYLQSTRDGVVHVYKKPGTYIVKIVRYRCQTSTTSALVPYPTPEKARFTVKDDRKIDTKISVKPWPDFDITFTLVNARKPPIKWNFGDGTVQTSGATVNHKFKAPGLYTVKAFDFEGSSGFPIETKIEILPDIRELTWSPEVPRSGEIVKFEAKNFISSVVKWDFGDGFSKTGGTKIAHIYRKHGYFTVKAIDLKDNRVFQKRIVVKPGEGAAIDLTIKDIELYFMENNKKFVVVPLGTKFLSATARIRFEGTGLLQGFWTVDGAAFSGFNLNLPPKKDFILTVNSVPASFPGLHILSLKLVKPRLIPEMDIEIPHIFYFVSRVKRSIETQIKVNKNTVNITWKPLPTASIYRVLVGKNLDEIYKKRNKGLILKNSYNARISLKPGKYTGIVLAEDINGTPLTSSEFISFEIKDEGREK